jgi:8-oxo-dGTP pyrophosphatase MutT (NUDIX family)
MEEKQNSTSGLTAAKSLLRAYDPTDNEQEVAQRRVLALLEECGERCLDRSHFAPGHITASTWIVSPTRDRYLLTHHKKLDRWLQLGGHVDGDADIIAAGVREAQEESGLSDFDLLIPGIFDIDIHVIPARKLEPEHLHFDIRFLLGAKNTNIAVSEESNDLRWMTASELRAVTEEFSVLRQLVKAEQAFLVPPQ